MVPPIVTCCNEVLLFHTIKPSDLAVTSIHNSSPAQVASSSVKAAPPAERQH